MVDATLSKLLAVDSDLKAQEAKLISQLEKIQTQRTSLQSVLEMFDADEISTESIPTEIASTQITEAAAGPEKKPTKAPSRPTTKIAKKGKSTQPRKSAPSAKSLRRGWQKYMRDEYLQTPLPEVVSGILEAQPKKVFEIKELVDTIVVKDIPSTERKGARNRISNLLAEGARKKWWQRPRAGCYRFSK